MTRNENDGSSRGRPRPRGEAARHEPAPGQRQRIAKLMARVGLCSRRDAEAWVVEGRVSVNGTVLTSPALDVAPSDVILVDGAPLPSAEKTRLFLFHKPRGLVTSDHDPEGRATVADFLREHWPDGPRVVTIGRLDINTEGLLLLTNDGGLARMLELPKTGWVRRYRVRAKGETDQGVLDGLFHGVTIDDVEYAGIEAKLDRVQGANCWLTMGLREGKNREIKRVLEHIGLEVNRLIRLSFGPFQLLDLPEGAVEEVKTRVLRDQLGENIAAAAGVDFQGAEEIVAAPVAARREAAERPRRDAADRRDPDHKPLDKRPRTPRDQARPDRRWPREGIEPPKLRERPAAGTRKHISALRVDEAVAATKGPRRRVERTATKDRKDRTVSVERLVGTRAAAPEPTRSRRGAGRFVSSLDTDQEHPGRRERGHAASREHASPAAMAKRARVARSGGNAAAPQDARSSGPRAGARSSREGRGERPYAAERSDGPRAARHSAEPAPGRERPRPSFRSDFGEKPRSRDPAEARGARGDRPPPRPRSGGKTGRKPFSSTDRGPERRDAEGDGRRQGRPEKRDRPGAERPKRRVRDAKPGGKPAGKATARPAARKPRGPAGKPTRARPSGKPKR